MIKLSLLTDTDSDYVFQLQFAISKSISNNFLVPNTLTTMYLKYPHPTYLL